MLLQCERKQMAMLYVVGEDPLLSCPDGERVARALQQLELLVVQDAFMSDTAKAADLVLPGFTFAENAGTFTNNEGRVQRVRPIYPPPAKMIMNSRGVDVFYPSPNQLQAKRDTDIFSAIASALGKDLGLSSLEAVFGEIAQAVPGYRSINVSELGEDGQFTTTRTCTARPDAEADVESQAPQQSDPPSPGQSCPESPCPESRGSADSAGTFCLITGNCMFHSGYLTEYSPTLATIADQAYVELNDQDASALGLQDQDRVTVTSPSHTVALRVKCNRQFPRGVAFIPENFKHIRLNRFSQNGEYPCLVTIQAQLSGNVQAQAAVPTNSAGTFPGGVE